MKEYELTVLFHPDLEMNLDPALDKVKKLIESNGGKITKEENDGKKRLAYAIGGQDFAVYYFFDVQDNCDLIEVEFQSESCTLYINHGNNYPDPGKAKWELNSKISSTIFTISKDDLNLDNLKGVEFRMAVNSKKYDDNDLTGIKTCYDNICL